LSATNALVACFLERGLGMGVDVVPPAPDLRNQGGDFGNDVHVDSVPARARKRES
jgi:hypothetical protein